MAAQRGHVFSQNSYHTFCRKISFGMSLAGFKNKCWRKHLKIGTFSVKKNVRKNRFFPGGAIVKKQSTNAGNARDMGSIPGLGRSPAAGYGNPLQYSCLENPMDRGAWQATVHGVTKQTWLSDWTHTWLEINWLPFNIWHCSLLVH